MTRATFVDDVFLRTAWNRRGLIVGHNLPFDLARLSISHHPPQSKGAVNARRVRVHADRRSRTPPASRSNAPTPAAAFIRLTIPGGVHPEQRNRQRGGRQRNHHGYFLDTATLGGAMLGGRPSLKRLAELLETEPPEDRRRPRRDDHAGVPRLPASTTCRSPGSARSSSKTLRHLPAAQATVGDLQRGEHRQSPPREDGDPPVPRSSTTGRRAITATVMETYYGGRAECAIRKIPVPGVYVDFTSQYPTVFVLQDLHRFLTANQVAYRHEDPARVQQLLDQLGPDQVLDKDFWRSELAALVLIAPGWRSTANAGPLQRQPPQRDADAKQLERQLQRRHPLPVRRPATVVHARGRVRVKAHDRQGTEDPRRPAIQPRRHHRTASSRSRSPETPPTASTRTTRTSSAASSSSAPTYAPTKNKPKPQETSAAPGNSTRSNRR